MGYYETISIFLKYEPGVHIHGGSTKFTRCLKYANNK